jgi:NCAIR mutase (PurE)-related protein
VDPKKLEHLLKSVQSSEVSVEQAVSELVHMPIRDLGHSRIDTHRELRCGFPEAVFGAGKTAGELVDIATVLLEEHGRFFATRVHAEGAAALLGRFPDAVFHERAKILELDQRAERVQTGLVLVVAAGTSDGPVAEEAALTARALGAHTELIEDVGVAGIHRLLAETERLRSARALVVVAGMEGALPSVVGGLVDRPLIAVPTSVGYGASFGGVAALLAMLNSCAAGVTVVNIDNGFGAGYAAALINRDFSSPE